MDMNKDYHMTIDGKSVAGASTIDVVNPARVRCSPKLPIVALSN